MYLIHFDDTCTPNGSAMIMPDCFLKNTQHSSLLVANRDIPHHSLFTRYYRYSLLSVNKIQLNHKYYND